jgi:hypothetical protein
MTTIEANAIVKAREEMKRAKKELDRAKLHETRYRGIPTRNDSWVRKDVHGTFVYRGIEYTK